ncbi:DNA sulfur modification protein DndC [Sphingomonas palmae]|uniref:DNA sulfur modification protein DndC n=1 Tax=Sphingomonas palmae TaxID=1855283 RepID=A0A1H7T520_9SPHN|nr:DNA phosphorothioation system sulfurtransferase DndC [Sphingomonas palmae]SEL79992.1 DNA sulfur modification protein DndC [Sphingomonas palmae]
MKNIVREDGAARMKRIHDDIREIYLADARPWVVGYSGGKDSTTALQLIWSAISELDKERRTKPIYVISSDTLVETPVVSNYIDVSLKRIAQAAVEQDMPVITHKVMPEVDKSFWVNLIGRGYPAPSRRFRWCTERLKIEPANDFIRSRVAEFGEVVMVLGVRRQESATRAQVMSLHSIEGSRLSKHSSLLNAFVYAPIADFSTDDVWTYLLQHASPWGNDNRDLVAMYRNAASGECPLVVDTSTPSCGNSRFGCWVCTVVERDKAMEAMIDSGEDWLTPLLEFRDMLAETQDPKRKLEFRDHRRRTGGVSFIGDTDRVMPGPYTMDFRRTLLRRLLETQRAVAAEAPPGEAPILIHPNELQEIRRLWRTERGDWEDSVPRIVRETLGRDAKYIEPDWVSEDAVAFTAEDGELLNGLCEEADVPVELVMRLLDIERGSHGLKRRHGVHTRIEDAFRLEWRDHDAVVAERRLAIGMTAANDAAIVDDDELELPFDPDGEVSR